VDGACQPLFAGSRLPNEQDTGLEAGDPFHFLEEFDHRLRSSDDRSIARRVADIAPQQVVSPEQAFSLARAAQHRDQLVRLDRPRDYVVGAPDDRRVELRARIS